LIFFAVISETGTAKIVGGLGGSEPQMRRERQDIKKFLEKVDKFFKGTC
jgi:hypothetical protein